MPKFYGKVGYGETYETFPGSGIHELIITEISYFGDVVQNSRRISEADKLNEDISVGNTISVVADAFAYEHFFSMRYVEWAGTLWTIQEVEVQRPRLILRLGGVYNGPTVSPTEEIGRDNR